MLFTVIGGIVFYIALSINERNVRKEEIRKAQEDGYEIYFTR